MQDVTAEPAVAFDWDNLQRLSDEFMPRSIRIFLSYAREDEAKVRQLAKKLRASGDDPWVDKTNLFGGDNWRLEIQKAVKDSDIVLACLSNHSTTKTGFVQKELKAAVDAANERPEGQVFIVPVRLDECKVPSFLEHLHCVDLHQRNGQKQLEQALTRFKRSLGRSSRPRSTVRTGGSGLRPTTVGARAGRRLDKSAAPGQVRPTTDLPGGSADSIFEFVKKSDCDITRVFVISHTGRVTLSLLKSAFTRLADPSERRAHAELRVLLRSPYLCDLKRAESIGKAISDLKDFAADVRWLKAEVRHYAIAPLLRGIVLEHSDQTYSAYLSFYDWPATRGLSQRGAHSQHAYTQHRGPREHWLLEVFMSWFDHLWGVNQIHTIMLDFDDTLFLTTDCQVKAWVEAIETSLEDNAFTVQALAPDVRRCVEKKASLAPLMTSIFLEEQQESEILQRLFKRPVPPRKLDLMKSHRWRVREELTESNAVPIPHILHDVRLLSAQYQIVIVSATSEKLVRKVLVKHELVGLFPFVIGRDVPRMAWQLVEGKTQHFLRVSNMLGVPLERMVFVGDSNSDYRSASQLGLHFVESRFNARLYDRSSLIKAPNPEGRRHVAEKDGELVAAIKAIEAEMNRP